MLIRIIIVFVLVLNNIAIGQNKPSPLDGKEYDIKYSKKSDSSMKTEDVFIFQNGKLYSKILIEEGYAEAVYSLEYDTLSADTSVTLSFEAEIVNSKADQTFLIEGKLNTKNMKQIKGDFKSYIKNKPKASCVFSGALKNKNESNIQEKNRYNENPVKRKNTENPIKRKTKAKF